MIILPCQVKLTIFFEVLEAVVLIGGIVANSINPYSIELFTGFYELFDFLLFLLFLCNMRVLMAIREMKQKSSVLDPAVVGDSDQT